MWYNFNIIKEKRIPNLLLQVFDGLTYPFSEKNVDLIVSRYAFHHFLDVADAIRQMSVGNTIFVKQ